jgi:hypothetical protein
MTPAVEGRARAAAIAIRLKAMAIRVDARMEEDVRSPILRIP